MSPSRELDKNSRELKVKAASEYEKRGSNESRYELLVTQHRTFRFRLDERLASSQPHTPIVEEAANKPFGRCHSCQACARHLRGSLDKNMGGKKLDQCNQSQRQAKT
jgi:hypothetical protein